MSSPTFDISIIGGGLIGLHLALGLLKRNIPVTIYEQAPENKDLGVGIGFQSSVRECQDALDPRIGSVVDGAGFIAPQTLRFVNPADQNEDVSMRGMEDMYDITVPLKGRFHYCHRGTIMEKLIALLPEGCLKFGKRLDYIVRDGQEDKIVMVFTDGSRISTDAVIGCDGVKSRVRYNLLEAKNPAAAIPHYAHESVYRSMVNMEKVARILGPYASNMTFWIGSGAHMITYPVLNNKFLNVAAFVRDEGVWPDHNKLTVQATKDEILEAYSKFHPAVRRLLEQLPDELNRWGIFDTFDHPLPSYAYGPIALAGDAAHASSPHHGSGAGMGIEDCLVLVTLLERSAAFLAGSGSLAPSKVLSQAFEVYDSIRRERSQWLVASSRRQGLLFKFMVADIDTNDKFINDTVERASKLYYFDWKAMVEQSVEEFARRLGVDKA